jgi:hypothetical protein
MTLPTDVLLNKDSFRDSPQPATQLFAPQLEIMRSILQKNVDDARVQTEMRHNKTAKPHNYVEGDRVFLKNEYIKPGVNAKHSVLYQGPFIILHFRGAVAKLQHFYTGKILKNYHNMAKLRKLTDSARDVLYNRLRSSDSDPAGQPDQHVITTDNVASISHKRLRATDESCSLSSRFSLTGINSSLCLKPGWTLSSSLTEPSKYFISSSNKLERASAATLETVVRPGGSIIKDRVSCCSVLQSEQEEAISRNDDLSLIRHFERGDSLRGKEFRPHASISQDSRTYSGNGDLLCCNFAITQNHRPVYVAESVSTAGYGNVAYRQLLAD